MFSRLTAKLSRCVFCLGVVGALWKRHRVAAVLMTGVNGAMAAIVAHNQRLVR